MYIRIEPFRYPLLLMQVRMIDATLVSSYYSTVNPFAHLSKDLFQGCLLGDSLSEWIDY